MVRKLVFYLENTLVLRDIIDMHLLVYKTFVDSSSYNDGKITNLCNTETAIVCIQGVITNGAQMVALLSVKVSRPTTRKDRTE